MRPSVPVAALSLVAVLSWSSLAATQEVGAGQRAPLLQNCAAGVQTVSLRPRAGLCARPLALTQIPSRRTRDLRT